MNGRSWRFVGAALVLAGVVLVVYAAGANVDTLEALGAGFAIFGAAIVIRTIRPGD